MKKFLLSILISFTCIILLSLLLSYIASSLQYNKSIIINKYLLVALSVLIFFIGGVIFGLINKKQGLLGSITFILVYFIMLIIFKGFSNINIISIILKFISFTSGSILLVNLRH